MAKSDSVSSSPPYITFLFDTFDTFDKLHKIIRPINKKLIQIHIPDFLLIIYIYYYIIL